MRLYSIMLIPVRCFTCGTVLANKYRYYLQEVRKRKGDEQTGITYLTEATAAKTAEGDVLDELGLDKLCCRRHMLTHVDVE